MKLKSIILGAASAAVAIPLTRKFLENRTGRKKFEGSANYWDSRYQRGLNSGSGSYGRLAKFKADIINSFVSKNNIDSVIEFGSGDGAQLQLANYSQYCGVDVSSTVIKAAKRMFKNDQTKEFITPDLLPIDKKYDLSLSLDVIYHLIEDEAFELYMKRLFDYSQRFVIVYSSDMTDDQEAPHVKHRRFSDWVRQNRKDFCLIEVIPNRYPFDPANPNQTTFADFYIYRVVD